MATYLRKYGLVVIKSQAYNIRITTNDMATGPVEKFWPE